MMSTRFSIQRKAKMKCLFERPHDGSVDHFECSRNDAGGNDATDAVGGIVDGIEYAQQRPH